MRVREKAETLFNKSEGRSGPGQLECDVVQGVSLFGYEVFNKFESSYLLIIGYFSKE